MKILVFDDNATHRAAAQAQLKDHDLTVVGTYDEAQAALAPKVDENRQAQIFEQKYGDCDYTKSEGVSQEERRERIDYWYGEASKLATVYPSFDVVLTDLLVPASRQAQGSMELVGKEMPVGIFIGLLAAVRARVKYVAVFTDSNHHSHPASACFDIFNHEGGEVRPTAFTVEGSKVILSNTRNWVNDFDPNDLSKEVDVFADLPSDVSYSQRMREWTAEGKVARAKNWRALLEYLTA